jgi:hypothetical protein
VVVFKVKVEDDPVLFDGLMWCIWRERNDRSFEDSERMVVKLKAFFFNTLFQWMVAYKCFHISSFHDFFCRCFSCIRHVYLGLPFAF